MCLTMKETVLLSIEENLNNVEADLKERKITRSEEHTSEQAAASSR